MVSGVKSYTVGQLVGVSNLGTFQRCALNWAWSDELDMRGRRRARIPATILLPRRWRRSWPGAVVVIIIALAAAYDRGAFSGKNNAPRPSDAVQVSGPKVRDADLVRYHNQAFRVARVIDGDTLDLDVPDGVADRTRVRLWGVDAPEIRGQSGATLQFGRAATKFVQEAVEEKEVHVELSPKTTRDRYGRLLAYIYIQRGGIMLNEQLIELGYGRAEDRFSHHYKNRFAAAERRAKRAMLGVWQASDVAATTELTGEPEDNEQH